MTFHSVFQIQTVFERIMKGVAEKPYRHHVVRPYYAIENKLGAGDSRVRDYFSI